MVLFCKLMFGRIRKTKDAELANAIGRIILTSFLSFRFYKFRFKLFFFKHRAKRNLEFFGSRNILRFLLLLSTFCYEAFCNEAFGL